MTNQKITIRDKTWSLLMKMNYNEPLLWKSKVRPENIEHVLNHIKEFIQWNMSNEFYIEFSDDYNYIKKIKKE
jgi:hypothetical protein